MFESLWKPVWGFLKKMFGIELTITNTTESEEQETDEDMTPLETLADELSIGLPYDTDSIEDTEDITLLSDEELEKRRILYFRAAQEWMINDTEESGGYAALANAYANELILRNLRKV